LTAIVAIAVSAVALPVDTEAAIIEKRGNCDNGYFACVTGQQVFWVSGDM
jgi:hypothetical protein